MFRLPVRDRRGFTLVELLVALVISGIIATVILQLLGSQGRFTRTQMNRQEVQQNARAALDVITNELRGTSTGAVTELGTDRIRVRQPRAWGLVCESRLGQASVMFPDTIGFRATASEQDSLAVIGTTLTAYGVSDITAQTPTTEQAECNMPKGNATTGETPNPLLTATSRVESRARMFSGNMPDLDGPSPVVAPVPAVIVYLYDSVEYRVGTYNGLSGRWILRNGQPLAGPIEGSGLRIRALDAADAPTANPTAATQLVISVITRSQGATNGVPQTDSVATQVAFRN